MFDITTRKDIVNIRLTRGDTAVIETIPVIDVDEDGKITDVDQPITLRGDDKVLFCVGSATGRIYLKKVLTADDYDDTGVLAVILKPSDTIHLQPFNYNFDFTYLPESGDAYTYASGIFSLIDKIGTIENVGEGNGG